MSIAIPYRKMEKVNKMGFIAKCDCGYVHNFKGKEINLEKSNSSIVVFKETFICPECNIKYDGIFEKQVNKDLWYKQLSPIGTTISLIFVFALLFGGYKFLNFVSDSNDPIKIENMTNKQHQEFQDWNVKQKKDEYDNKKIGN